MRWGGDVSQGRGRGDGRRKELTSWIPVWFVQVTECYQIRVRAVSATLHMIRRDMTHGSQTLSLRNRPKQQPILFPHAVYLLQETNYGYIIVPTNISQYKKRRLQASDSPHLRHKIHQLLSPHTCKYFVYL